MPVAKRPRAAQPLPAFCPALARPPLQPRTWLRLAASRWQGRIRPIPASAARPALAWCAASAGESAGESARELEGARGDVGGADAEPAARDEWGGAVSGGGASGQPSALVGGGGGEGELAVPVSARVAALLEDVSERPEFYLSGVGAASGAVLGTVVLSAALEALEFVPLLPDALRVIGVGYVFWFLSKYLFSAKHRAELAADVQYLLDEVRQPPEIAPAPPAPAAGLPPLDDDPAGANSEGGSDAQDDADVEDGANAEGIADSA